MFTIDTENPLKLTMVSEPAPTLGQFAMSIAYSSKYQKACVLNGGAVNGVACYSVDAEKGLTPDGVGLRKFGFPATTPPQLGGSLGSGSDIQFLGDSSKLVATFKGRDKPKAKLGHVLVFDVDEDGNVAKTATDNQVSPLVQPFGFALSSASLDSIFISDVTFGGALVSLDTQTNKISVDSVVNSTTFKASCWAIYSPALDTFYNIDAAATDLGKVSSSGNLEGLISYTTSLEGGFDSVVDGSTSYMLTAVNELAVLDLASGKILQTLEYGSAEDRPYWTGMAMFPASSLLSGGM